MSGTLYRNTFGWIPGLNHLGTNKEAGRPNRADDVSVEIIYHNRSNKRAKPEVKAKGAGSWLSHLVVDGEVLWRIEQALPKW